MKEIASAYKRFATERFRLPSKKQLLVFERRIKSKLPSDFRQYVLEFNGGIFEYSEIVPDHDECPSSRLSDTNGLGSRYKCFELNQPRGWNLFDDNDPPKIIPIGGTPMGDFIMLVTELGETPGAILFKQAFGEFLLPR
jgi:hypothetical protein